MLNIVKIIILTPYKIKNNLGTLNQITRRHCKYRMTYIM